MSGMLTSSGLVWPCSLNALWPKNTPRHMILLGIRKPTNDNSEMFEGLMLKEVEIGQNLLLKGTVRPLGIKETTLSPM